MPYAQLAMGVMEMSRSPAAISNGWPPLTATGDARALEPLNVPAVKADHRLTWVSVSPPASVVSQRTTAVLLLAPPDAAPVTAWMRVLVAATFDVPAAPGSPTW